MSVPNLAIVFGPTLLQSGNDTGIEVLLHSKKVSLAAQYLIEHYEELYDLKRPPTKDPPPKKEEGKGDVYIVPTTQPLVDAVRPAGPDGDKPTHLPHHFDLSELVQAMKPEELNSESVRPRQSIHGAQNFARTTSVDEKFGQPRPQSGLPLQRNLSSTSPTQPVANPKSNRPLSKLPAIPQAKTQEKQPTATQSNEKPNKHIIQLQEGWSRENATTSFVLPTLTFPVDHLPYHQMFAGKEQATFIGNITGSDDTAVISILLEPETGTFPVPVLRGLVRTAAAGQSDFSIPESELDGSQGDSRSVKILDYLSKTYFTGSHLRRLETQSPDLENLFRDFEKWDPQITTSLSYGLIYVKKGQSSPDTFLQNELDSELTKFLEVLGAQSVIHGLNPLGSTSDLLHQESSGSAGQTVYQRNYKGWDNTFFASGLLPLYKRRGLLQKELITVVFLEKDAPPFDPLSCPSTVSQAFFVVQPGENPMPGYWLGVTTKEDDLQTYATKIQEKTSSLPCPAFFPTSDLSNFTETFFSKLITCQLQMRRRSAVSFFMQVQRNTMIQFVLNSVNASKS